MASKRGRGRGGRASGLRGGAVTNTRINSTRRVHETDNVEGAGSITETLNELNRPTSMARGGGARKEAAEGRQDGGKTAGNLQRTPIPS